ncbi:hypothetical protein D9M71_727600 [compost metagenome]
MLFKDRRQQGDHQADTGPGQQDRQAIGQAAGWVVGQAQQGGGIVQAPVGQLPYRQHRQAGQR